MRRAIEVHNASISSAGHCHISRVTLARRHLGPGIGSFIRSLSVYTENRTGIHNMKGVSKVTLVQFMKDSKNEA